MRTALGFGDDNEGKTRESKQLARVGFVTLSGIRSHDQAYLWFGLPSTDPRDCSRSSVMRSILALIPTTYGLLMSLFHGGRVTLSRESYFWLAMSRGCLRCEDSYIGHI